MIKRTKKGGGTTMQKAYSLLYEKESRKVSVVFPRKGIQFLNFCNHSHSHSYQCEIVHGSTPLPIKIWYLYALMYKYKRLHKMFYLTKTFKVLFCDI